MSGIDLSNTNRIHALKGRQSNLAMRLQYPGLYPRLIAATEVRIADSRLAKRRPSVLMRVRDEDNYIEIRPKLNPSATGWVVNKVISVRIENRDTKRSIILRLDTDGLRLGRWHSKPELNLPLLLDIDAALAPLSDNFWALFTSSFDHCGWCGRGLTDPKSKEIGIGPECNASFAQTQRDVEALMERSST